MSKLCVLKTIQLPNNKSLVFNMYQGMNLSTFKELFPDFEVVQVKDARISRNDKKTCSSDYCDEERCKGSQVIGFVIIRLILASPSKNA